MNTELSTTQKTPLATQVESMFGGGGYQIPIDAELPQIKILRETPQYELPDGSTVKELVGHIIYWHNANQFYETDFGGGDSQTPPTCSSSDGVLPDGGTTPLQGPCNECPNNKYGSAGEGEKGKACQNTIRLYILVDGDVIPCILKAPPSSLGKKESLVRWLTNAPNVASKAGVGVKYQPIKVRFTLHRKDFSSGMSASVIDVETIRVLGPGNSDDLDQLKKLGQLYQSFMQSYHSHIKQAVANEAPGAKEQDNIPF